MSAARLRPATAADAEALVPLLVQLGYPGGEAFIQRRIVQLLAHPDALLLLAEGEDGRVQGFVSAHFIPQLALSGDFCRISYLCVDASQRSQGLGAQLEAAVVAHARQRGCDRIELHSHSRRVDAHRFYARRGYEESPKYLVKRVD